MVEVLHWLAFAVPVTAMGVGCVWAFGQQSLSAVGEQVRRLDPPDGVTLTPIVRHAIGEELYRRRHLGTRTALVVCALAVVAFHPMYAPESLSHGPMFGVSILGGLIIGETYAATHAARMPAERRVAALTPRHASTYLSTAQRIAQVALPVTLATVVVSLLVDARTASAPSWVVPATYACGVWFALSCALLGAQRWVRAQPLPVGDEDAVIVREYVTATAIQQLHKAIWATGMIVYMTVVGYTLGLDADFSLLLVAITPPVAVWFGTARYRRWRHLPDPVWNFARTGSST